MSIPKPVLSFVVGVTGHRSARLKEEHRARIAQYLSDVFANIEAECRAEFDHNKALYAEETPRLSLITSLADGADALAVQQVPPGWTSIGILPYPEERYVTELRGDDPSKPDEAAVAAYKLARERTVDNVVILPQSGPHDTSGFARARSLLLRQIDVLVAVWDGHPPEEPGGTADVVVSALEAGIPVIWIAAERVQKPWAIARIDDVVREMPMADATSGPIAEIVMRQLSVGERRTGRRGAWDLDESGTTAEKRLRDFFTESVPAWHIWVYYDWIKALPRFWHWRWTQKVDNFGDVSRVWQGFLDALPDAAGFKGRIESVLLPRFAAADALASYYSHKYRSAYVLAYVFSAIAVTLAIASFVLVGTEHHDAVPGLEIVLAFIEFIFVGLIVGIVTAGQVGRWHDRWLDYRALAEMLRHLRFLGLLGQYEKRAYLEAAARPSAGWVLWYFRAAMRELGMPAGDLGPEYQRQILLAMVPAEIDEQVGYHLNNMGALRRLHRGLHLLGNICFGAALIILGLFLGAWLTSLYIPWIAPRLIEFAHFVPVCTALLPAFGAALAGIRFTGDFEGFAARSAQTGSELEALKQRCDLALDRLDFDTTASVLFESARIMAADISGWTTLYSRKHLTLPG